LSKLRWTSENIHGHLMNFLILQNTLSTTLSLRTLGMTEVSLFSSSFSLSPFLPSHRPLSLDFLVFFFLWFFSPSSSFSFECFCLTLAFSLFLSKHLGFMGTFKSIVAEINAVMGREWGRNKAPLVIWGYNNYNGWEYDVSKKEWYQNASTGMRERE